MKRISDLKIGDTVWEVNGLEIVEKKVKKLSEEIIEITGRTTYKTSTVNSITSDRLIEYNTLCITIEDACELARVNCFEKIKEHIQRIKEEATAIDAIGVRINQLSDLQIK